MAQATEIITMSIRELDRLKVVQAIVDDHLRCAEAAKQLDLTVRQMQRLVKQYRMHESVGLCLANAAAAATTDCLPTWPDKR